MRDNRYKSIKRIKENKYKKIELVENLDDHCLYICRETQFYNLSLYAQLKNIHSFHIPMIKEIIEEDDHLILIEEYINSQTLYQWMSYHQLSNEDIISIIDQLCDALEILHHQQPPIIHRDIKPENIFYDGSRVVLFDFDIARQYQQDKSKDTVVLGSVGYAAPEQFGFHQSSERSDIYSLGVLLNVLTTGELPGHHDHNSIYSYIINKAIAIDEKDRYQNIKEFRNAFHRHHHIDRINIPGFRKNKYSHMIIAILGYLFIIYLSFNTTVEGTSFPGLPIIFGIFYLLSVFYFCDYHHILYKLTRNTRNNVTKYLTIIGVYFLFFFTFSLFVSFL